MIARWEERRGQACMLEGSRTIFLCPTTIITMTIITHTQDNHHNCVSCHNCDNHHGCDNCHRPDESHIWQWSLVWKVSDAITILTRMPYACHMRATMPDVTIITRLTTVRGMSQTDSTDSLSTEVSHSWPSCSSIRLLVLELVNFAARARWLISLSVIISSGSLEEWARSTRQKKYVFIYLQSHRGTCPWILYSGPPKPEACFKAVGARNYVGASNLQWKLGMARGLSFLTEWSTHWAAPSPFLWYYRSYLSCIRDKHYTHCLIFWRYSSTRSIALFVALHYLIGFYGYPASFCNNTTQKFHHSSWTWMTTQSNT